jgi:hypothetical protein
MYHRLPGTGYRYILPGWALVLLFFVIGIFVLLFRGRRTQLWLGDDHLLMVELEGYREHYRRFSYRDIQALVIRKTPDGKAVNGVLGALVLLLLGLSLLVNDPVGRIIFWTIAGLFGLVLLVNFLRGPSCKCDLRTAVQVVDLPSISRLRTARKVLQRLKPLIVAAQGRVELEHLGNAVPPPSNPAPAAIGRPAAAVAQPPLIRHDHGRVHQVLFWLCLADAPLTIAHYIGESAWTTALSSLLSLATLSIGIVTLVRQQRTDLPPGLRRIPWFVLGSLLFFMVFGFFYGMIRVISLGPDQIQPETLLNEPVLIGLSAVSTLISTALGVVGLLLLARFRREYRARQSPPPVQLTGSPA